MRSTDFLLAGIEKTTSVASTDCSIDTSNSFVFSVVEHVRDQTCVQIVSKFGVEFEGP